MFLLLCRHRSLVSRDGFEFRIVCAGLYLDKWGMLGAPLVQEFLRVGIGVCRGEHVLLCCDQEAPERTEVIVHGRGLMAGMHHAVCTAWIAALGAIILPLGG